MRYGPNRSLPAASFQCLTSFAKAFSGMLNTQN